MSDHSPSRHSDVHGSYRDDEELNLRDEIRNLKEYFNRKFEKRDIEKGRERGKEKEKRKGKILFLCHIVSLVLQYYQLKFLELNNYN